MQRTRNKIVPYQCNVPQLNFRSVLYPRTVPLKLEQDVCRSAFLWWKACEPRTNALLLVPRKTVYHTIPT